MKPRSLEPVRKPPIKAEDGLEVIWNGGKSLTEQQLNHQFGGAGKTLPSQPYHQYGSGEKSLPAEPYHQFGGGEKGLPAEPYNQYWGGGKSLAEHQLYHQRWEGRNQDPFGQGGHQKQEAPQDRKICGIKRWIIWTVAGLVAVLLAAVIGGLVGHSIGTKERSSLSSACKSSAQNNTALPPLSSTGNSSAEDTAGTPPPSEDEDSAASSPGTNDTTKVVEADGCPKTNGTDYNAGFGGSFKKLCYTDYFRNDLHAVTVTSWDLCIEACAAWNWYKGVHNASAPCVGSVYTPRWQDQDERIINKFYRPTNCYLKYRLEERYKIAPKNYELHTGMLLQ
ncbi:MAG: hypothetical protein M1837_004249 [Sclerophora amabilis]|nr:MAG: hypothetical protein M1837_004249 [Sclerophora amabilis]